FPPCLTLWNDLPGGGEPSSPAVVGPDHPAYIIFTSGTTGVPKGVVVTAGNLAHFLSAMRDLYAMHPGDRAGQFCEPSFDLSVFEIFAAFDAGASLHVVPESRVMAPAGFIRQQELTVWTSVPSVISIATRMKLLAPGIFPTLRISYFIGEALPVEAAKAWQAAAPSSVVDNHYGPTEATVACTVQRLTDPVVATPGRGTMAIGKPYAGLEAEIVDEQGRFVAAGETGELALHGPQVADGYLDDPEQTSRRFPLLDHPRLGRTRWYLTGDLAYRDGNDVLHCLGRIDNQVKVLGHRIELEDLEAHLRVASGTDAVATVAWPIVGGSATGIAAFVCAPATSLSEIRSRLAGLVPAYMVPRQFRVLDALPLSTNGKVDRNALRALLEQKP
ncbi:MAG: AMP-binding protein, partial [Candidatus Binatia bacterium]